MTRQRLLLVTDSFSRGREVRHVRAILGRLSRRRFEVRLVSLFEGPPPPEEIERARVETLHLDASPDDLGEALAPLLRPEHTDVVHAHSLAAAAAVLDAPRDVPLVLTVHQIPEGGGHPSEVDPGGLFADLGDAGDRRRVLATTGALRERLEREWGVEQVRVMPPFVDVAEFRERCSAVDRASARRRWALEKGSVAVLHVGVIDRRRKAMGVLEAFQVARRELPSLRLFVVGGGPDLPEARALAEELNLGDSAVFLGEAPDLASVYRMADIFILPVATEEFPLPLLDAMAVGLPAVVGGGEPELAPVEAGAAVEAHPDRAEDLARQLLKLAYDPRSREEMGRAAMERAAELDAGLWIPRLETLYADL